MSLMDSSFAKDVTDGCTLAVRVHPRARKNSVTGVHADTLKIALTAPPVDGKANEALIAFLADTLRLPRARVALVSGLTNRTMLRITGKSAAEVAAALLPIETC